MPKLGNVKEHEPTKFTYEQAHFLEAFAVRNYDFDIETLDISVLKFLSALIVLVHAPCRLQHQLHHLGST